MIGKGIDHLDIMKERCKRALDAGANAAVNCVEYNASENLSKLGMGFGEQQYHRNNLLFDRDESLAWFYRVFYRNLNIEKNPTAQQNMKKHMPMKALLTFERLMIADVTDSWIVDKHYEMEYKGVLYRFTLSDRVFRVDTATWGRDVDFGISVEEREALVNEFIKSNLNNFLNRRENFESGYYYDVNIAVSDIDLKTDDIDGINFIVLTEGLPLPALNPWQQSKYYAFGLGGSEITR